MTDRIKLTEENFRVKIGTHTIYFRMEDGFEFPIPEGAFYTELKKQILDENNVFGMIDMVMGKFTTINDVLELVKENKQLKNELGACSVNYHSLNKKLEKIKENSTTMHNSDFFYSTLEILKDE